MSAMGDKKHDKRTSKRRYDLGTGREVTWAEADPGSIRDVITAVTATGCAIRFGYSKDKGAYAIGIVGDGDPYTIWAASADELDITFEKLLQAFA